ncbi:MAG: hypothetical protein RSC10_09760, partial [Longicatena sp.]
IKGYTYDYDKNRYISLCFTTTQEYQTFWVKNNKHKIKITKWHPSVRVDNYHFYKKCSIGDIDYYGWKCYEIIECVTCVELDKKRVIYID